MNELILNTQPFKAVFVVGPQESSEYPGNPCRDVAAAIAQESTKEGMPLVLDGFCIEMRERCHAAYKLYSEDGMPAPWFQFEDSLGLPSSFFADKSPSEAYRAFSDYVTEQMGEATLGQWVVERANFYREKQRKAPPEQRAQGIITADVTSVANYNRVAKSYGVGNTTLVTVGQYVPVGLGGIEADRTVNIEFTTNEADLVQAVREAAPHLFIKIATQI